MEQLYSKNVKCKCKLMLALC